MKWCINKFGYEQGTFLGCLAYLVIICLIFPWFCKGFIAYLQWVKIA